MLKITLIFLVLGLCHDCSFCGPNRGSSQYKSSFVGRRNSYIGNSNFPTSTSTTAAPMTPKEYLQAKGSFSAFTLIVVIILATISCLGFYYIVICYPLMCRTEKNYQFMDVSSTMTSTTSRSIQSIEHYPTGKSLDNYPTSEKSIATYPSSAPILSAKQMRENSTERH